MFTVFYFGKPLSFPCFLSKKPWLILPCNGSCKNAHTVSSIWLDCHLRFCIISDISQNFSQSLAGKNIIQFFIKLQNIQQTFFCMFISCKQIAVFAAFFPLQYLFFIFFIYYDCIQYSHSEQCFFQTAAGSFIQFLSKFNHFVKFLVWNVHCFQPLAISDHCFRSRWLRLFLIFPCS